MADIPLRNRQVKIDILAVVRGIESRFAAVKFKFRIQGVSLGVTALAERAMFRNVRRERGSLRINGLPNRTVDCGRSESGNIWGRSRGRLRISGKRGGNEEGCQKQQREQKENETFEHG